MSVKQKNNLQKAERNPCGGAMVESDPAARDVRWPKSNWEIPAQQVQCSFLDRVRLYPRWMYLLRDWVKEK
jgi:hypothetical protein